MKSININDEVVLIEGVDPQAYTDLIRSVVVAVAPGKAVPFDEQVKRCRILAALDDLDEGADSLELEDEDAKTLKVLLREMSWAVVSPGIVEFTESVLADCK